MGYVLFTCMKVCKELWKLYGEFDINVENKQIKTANKVNNYNDKITKKNPIFSKNYFQKSPMINQQ